MPDLCAIITSFVLVSLLLIPLLAACAWLASRVAARVSPLAEHRVWVAAWLLSLTLPALPAARHLLLASVRFSFLSSPAFGHAISIRLLPSSASSLLAPSPAGTFLVAGLWLLTVLFFLLRLLWSVAATVGLLRAAAPPSPNLRLDELWQACQRAFSLPPTQLLVSPGIAAPLTATLSCPVVLLPSAFFDQVSDADLQTALAHECAHIRRQDFRKNLFYEVLGTLIAFHPASALLRARIAASREMVCDAAAIRTLVPRPVYVRSLLRLATLVADRPSTLPSHAIGIFDANVLEKRIMALKAEPPQPNRSSKLVAAALSAILLSSAATGVATAALLFTPEFASANGDAAAPPVYTIGGNVSAPQLIYQKDPEFPASAQNEPASFKGSCLLSLVVDRSGVPRDVHIIRSLRKDFDGSAIDAVRQYRFKPAQLSGKPVAVKVSIDVNFQKF